MDNNELDKILKEKLNGKIKPTPEFEKRIKDKIEEEKKSRLLEKDNNQNKKEKSKKHSKLIITSLLYLG